MFCIACTMPDPVATATGVCWLLACTTGLVLCACFLCQLMDGAGGCLVVLVLESGMMPVVQASVCPLGMYAL